jgi:hypothetical protein
MPKIQAVKQYTCVVPENEATQNSNVDCRQITSFTLSTLYHGGRTLRKLPDCVVVGFAVDVMVPLTQQKIEYRQNKLVTEHVVVCVITRSYSLR